MFSWLGRTASSCLRPLGRYARMNKDDDDSLGGEDDALLWCKDLEKHSHGEFSFAVVQANEVLEDQSQVETGQHATFVGVYDGHGGPDASRFICDHLFHNLIKLARDNGTISEDILRNAFSETEDGFLTLVRRAYELKPLIAAIGSCCLVGVICKGTLFVANLGDSRAVLGSINRLNKIVAEQLTKDHNASFEEVRKELRSLHPEDSHIVVMKQGVWRIKGIIQVSRSIGDAYLKRPEFALDPSFPRFHLHEPLHQPVLRSDPSICTRVLQPNDKFLIFASDGLWEYLTNEDAVEIVHNNPRVGIAKRLLISAINQACKKRRVTYNELKKYDKGVRRRVHDDITVVVIFIDHEMFENNASVPELSIRGFVDTVGPSNFNFPQGIDVKQSVLSEGCS
ncbi:probable protein phosphatase 2C 25 [Olea europaea var. sylvestris]|uniref:probable protein phosphatase 2C 25 n=1 Tax=Olea europaea var. sylvestris TaxID=158386 RepID=UPI000C1D67F8|nr:probable protein phosphatase 2C 25 [Olea europaea var. sylvestris]XP_022882914.1 probable protein phosphatase 2C 25 [Olea europaea var. sylvestris]XP_022882915.1 probable protein phosphatase 2C 25 [Olea europaea var. sylvestris]